MLGKNLNLENLSEIRARKPLLRIIGFTTIDHYRKYSIFASSEL